MRRLHCYLYHCSSFFYIQFLFLFLFSPGIPTHLQLFSPLLAWENTANQDSVAIQIRSEHIGLNSYLYRRKVPGVANSKCQCGYPSQNVKHMVLACPQWAKGRGEVLRQTKDRSFEAMMNSPDDMKRMTEWILSNGWLEQFRLAEEVEIAIKERMTRSGKG